MPDAGQDGNSQRPERAHPESFVGGDRARTDAPEQHQHRDGPDPSARLDPLAAAADQPLDPAAQRRRRAARKSAPAMDAPRLSALGCPYQNRCPRVMLRCRAEMPPASLIDGGGTAACFLHAQDTASAAPRVANSRACARDPGTGGPCSTSPARSTVAPRARTGAGRSSPMILRRRAASILPCSPAPITISGVARPDQSPVPARTDHARLFRRLSQEGHGRQGLARRPVRPDWRMWRSVQAQIKHDESQLSFGGLVGLPG